MKYLMGIVLGNLFGAYKLRLLLLFTLVWSNSLLAQEENLKDDVTRSERPGPVAVPITSANETREFRYIALSNKLKVLLVHDVQAEKSAASLDVNVGAGEDPAERNGLAHFLEHMLFLGTEKYPVAGEFQEFVSGHGGRHNAYTSLVNTNYFFDVDHDHFTLALDRFAQFFIAPTFDETYVDRERNAVHSEFRAKYLTDYRRILDVYREILPASHPMGTFTTGSLDTLDHRKGRSLRQDLLDFYQKYYSSERMALSIISAHSLDDMEKWVRDYFSGIQPKKPPVLSEHEGLFSEGFLPATIEIQPVKEQRQLMLVFPVSSAEPHYRKKPLVYLGHILGHEGAGSLFSSLKKAELANSLSAGPALQWRGGEAFSLTIGLTEKGFAHIDDIEKAVFAYIELLNKGGVTAWRFQELQRLGQIRFEFGGRRDPFSEVITLASRLQDTQVQDLLRKPYYYDDFDPDLIQSYLSKLVPSNRLRIVVSPDISVERKSKIYATPYRLQRENLEALSQRLKQPLNTNSGIVLSNLALPSKNRFIANDFSEIGEKSKEALQQKPDIIYRRKGHTVWYLNDNFTDTPKVTAKVRYFLPQVQDDAAGFATSLMYVELLKAYLNETYYEALTAGLNFSFSASSRGVDISFEGYSDTLDLLAARGAQKDKKI